MGRRKKLYVCTGDKCCPGKKSEALFQAFKIAVQALALSDRYKIKRANCLDLCKHGPAVTIKPDSINYGQVSPACCDLILSHHIESKQPLDELVIKKSNKHKTHQ